MQFSRTKIPICSGASCETKVKTLTKGFDKVYITMSFMLVIKVCRKPTALLFTATVAITNSIYSFADCIWKSTILTRWGAPIVWNGDLQHSRFSKEFMMSLPFEQLERDNSCEKKKKCKRSSNNGFLTSTLGRWEITTHKYSNYPHKILSHHP